MHLKKEEIVIILKIVAIWLIMAGLAILNGVLRDNFFAPILGPNVALPLSSISLAIVVVLITYISIPFFGRNPKSTFIALGIAWMLIILFFEFAFGYYSVLRPWGVMLQVFNIPDGNLFILVLLVSLLAPYLMARFRGYINASA